MTEINEHLQIPVNFSQHFEKWCKGLQNSSPEILLQIDSFREMCISKKYLQFWKMRLLSLSEESIQPRTSLRKSMKVFQIFILKTRQRDPVQMLRRIATSTGRPRRQARGSGRRRTPLSFVATNSSRQSSSRGHPFFDPNFRRSVLSCIELCTLLDRRRFLQSSTRWKALDEIY